MFLRVKGIELDNNQSERILKYMILQRKNSLFFGNKKSAVIHSELHSLVATCKLNGINAFAYLNWLQENSRNIRNGKGNYLPWDFVEYMNSCDKATIAA